MTTDGIITHNFLGITLHVPITTPKQTRTRRQIVETLMAPELQKDSFKLAKENSPQITEKFSRKWNLENFTKRLKPTQCEIFA